MKFTKTEELVLPGSERVVLVHRGTNRIGISCPGIIPWDIQNTESVEVSLKKRRLEISATLEDYSKLELVYLPPELVVKVESNDYPSLTILKINSSFVAQKISMAISAAIWGAHIVQMRQGS